LPPTISKVGARTRGRYGPARSGRPPRETTAPIAAGPLGRSHECRGSAGTGAEIPNPQQPGIRVLDKPIGDPREPRCEEADVKAELRRPQIDRLLLCGQQVDQQCRELRLIKQLRDLAVTRTVTTAAAAVSKQDDAASALGNVQIPLERRPSGRDTD
jgi:hypothetical protein